MLGRAKVDTVFHFNSIVARRQAVESVLDSSALPEKGWTNSNIVTADVNAGKIEHKFVHPVQVQIMTPVEIEPTAKPKELRPITLVNDRKLKPEEFFIHVLALSDVTQGRGFRQPSAKVKNWRSTSLVEQLSIKMGVMQKAKGPERSERGEKKQAAQIECNTRIVLDRLIAQYPDRARQAKKEERLRDWFVGKVMEALSGTPKLDDLKVMVQQRIEEFKVPAHVIEFEEFRERAKRYVEDRVLDKQAMAEAA